jgi:hypothetical protein
VATLAAEKELLMIDKEINLFKKKMEPNGKQLSDQIKGSQLNAHKRNRLNQSRSNSVTDVKNVLFSSCYISNSELFSHMRIKTQEINHSPIVEFLMTDISPKNEETKALTNTDVTINDGAVKGIISEIKENSMNLLSSGFVYNRQDLVCSVWKKWKSCTIDKKLSTAKDHISETQNMSKTAQRYINNKVMRKCWDTWFHMVREKKRALSAAHGKQEREEKIKRFLKVLQEQKQSLIAIKAPAIIKDVCNIKKDSAKNSQYSYHNFPSINKGQNKQNIQDNVGLKTKTFPSHLYNDYQRRFEVQQNIIAEQKSKLEEQSKLIKELQLAHMRLQTEKSTIEAQAEIHKTLSSCDLRLKPKAKQVKSTMSTGDKRMEFPEDKPVVVSLKTVPTILNRMEERAQEREKRWRLIKERKQKLIEEKERGKREEEEEKKRKEECEKRQKIEELKEKRRLEKQIEVQKKREREKMHYLIIQATIQYKKLLMKKVILSFKQLVVLKWKLMEIAEKHYKTKLLCNSFQTWRIHVQSVISLRMYEVTALYNRILMKKVFRGLFQVIKSQSKN